MGNKLYTKYTHCINCKEGFSIKNTHTIMGWRETQISQMCEDCFDECTLGSEYDEDLSCEDDGENTF